MYSLCASYLLLMSLHLHCLRVHIFTLTFVSYLVPQRPFLQSSSLFSRRSPQGHGQDQYPDSCVFLWHSLYSLRQIFLESSVILFFSISTYTEEVLRSDHLRGLGSEGRPERGCLSFFFLPFPSPISPFYPIKGIAVGILKERHFGTVTSMLHLLSFFGLFSSEPFCDM